MQIIIFFKTIYSTRLTVLQTKSNPLQLYIQFADQSLYLINKLESLIMCVFFYLKKTPKIPRSSSNLCSSASCDDPLQFTLKAPISTTSAQRNKKIVRLSYTFLDLYSRNSSQKLDIGNNISS